MSSLCSGYRKYEIAKIYGKDSDDLECSIMWVVDVHE